MDRTYDPFPQPHIVPCRCDRKRARDNFQSESLRNHSKININRYRGTYRFIEALTTPSYETSTAPSASYPPLFNQTLWTPCSFSTTFSSNACTYLYSNCRFIVRKYYPGDSTADRKWYYSIVSISMALLTFAVPFRANQTLIAGKMSRYTGRLCDSEYEE